jgi:hypothetical protein
MKAVAALIAAAVSAGVATGQPIDESTLTSWRDFKYSTDKRLTSLATAVERMKWPDACIAYGKEYRSGKSSLRETALLRYLESEHLILPKDRGHIGDRSIGIGMTECGVLASIGLPDVVNNSTTARGTDGQLVYSSRRLYVYTEQSPLSRSRIVRSFQH